MRSKVCRVLLGAVVSRVGLLAFAGGLLWSPLVSGDLVITGTPPGVGLGMKPPVFVKPGDVMELGIDGLGSQRQRVVRGKV